MFSGLKKAFDWVSGEELWYSKRKSGLTAKYVRVVQDIYTHSVTAVTCLVETRYGIREEVGLHQGLVLSHFYTRVGDGQVKGRYQKGVSLGYDVRR